jgi:hypothetical protein
MESGTPQPAYAYYVVPVEPRKRKQCGGCCCLMTLAIFLLCFFLIPRTPSVWLKANSLKITGDYMSGTFSFQNNDYYKVEWSKAEIDMYWVPISGSYVFASCSEDPNTTCESDLFIDGMCAIKIGQFEKGKNFVTEAKSTKNEDFQLNTPTSQEQACMANMVTSAVKWGAARLVTRGHVSNKGQGEIKVSDAFYYYYHSS